MHLARATLLLASLTAAHTAFAADVAPVEEKPLRFGSFTLYTENDKYFAGTDQNYTNGLKLSALSTDLRNFTDDSIPAPIRGLSRLFGRHLERDKPYKLGLSLGQNIYTPEDTNTPLYQPNDRPYAGWLYVGVAFQVYHPPATAGDTARLDVFEVTAGMVGPAALGREFQNNFHDLINVERANGWDNQIKNEPGINLVYERKYRYSTANARTGWGADFIPHAGVSLGNIFTYANAGFEVRAGYALPADFGSNLIRASGDSNALVRRPLSVFVFAATDGRAVARDITLDGNSFRDSASIDKKHFVADFYAGLGVGTTHWQFTYAQTYRTIEYVGQDDRSVFGSISLSFFY
jgi:lipid A 3-O-deacylase